MAWYHPDLYHRVLSFSGTFVNQQWPYNPATPRGCWEIHQHLIPESPVKPLRIWMEVGDRDLLNPNVMRDDAHDWVLANEYTAKALAAKGYHYQFSLVTNAGPLRRQHETATAARSSGVCMAGLPGCRREGQVSCGRAAIRRRLNPMVPAKNVVWILSNLRSASTPRATVPNRWCSGRAKGESHTSLRTTPKTAPPAGMHQR